MIEPVRLLRIPEVAERLAVSRRTVEHLLHDGELRTVRVRGTVRISTTEVARFIALRERRRVA
jgi:excisionase family DNA binding protein